MLRHLRLRDVRRGCLLSLISALVTLALLNGCLPLVVTISDFPYFTSRAGYGLVRVPGQRGVSADAGGRAVPFTINAQGFNAPRDYDGQPSIAVIGDSFVEALQVAPGEAFPDRLDAALAARNCQDTLTYRFGIGGAPLSHYLGIMRQVGRDYQPAVYIVNVAGNDYVESLVDHAPWGTYYYLLQPEGETFHLLDPRPFEPDDRARALDRLFPLRRYLNYNLRLDARLRQGLYSGHVEPPSAREADRVLVRRSVSWLIGALQAEAVRQNAVLILAAGADFIPYSEGVPYLDLSGIVPAGDPAYLAPDGGHWNARGHAAVAEALASRLAVDCEALR